MTKNKLLSSIALFALLLTAPQTKAQTNPAQTFQLENGLSVIIKQDKRAPVALQMLWVKVGSMDEVDGKSGVAHALEHMMFKGTEKLGVGEFSKKIAALGGQENAFTYLDYTGYYQKIPASNLEKVMELEADRFANTKFSDEEFQKELAVVKEERRLRTDDNPHARLYEQQMAATFMASPYRRPIIGWAGDLDTLTADDTREFYKKWYSPANAALVIVGDVEIERTLELAKKYYGKIPAKPVPERKPRPEPEQNGLKQIELKANTNQSVISLAYKVPKIENMQPSEQSDEALALTVLASILDGYSSARLQRALIQGENRVADGASASNGLLGRGPQLFRLMAIPAEGKTIEQVEKALLEQIQKIAKEGVSDAELKRVKNQYIASQIYKRDSIMGQANELAINWILNLPNDSDAQLIERVKKIDSSQLQKVAEKYFTEDKLTKAVLIPQNKKEIK